jgi:hypothetical protein
MEHYFHTIQAYNSEGTTTISAETKGSGKAPENGSTRTIMKGNHDVSNQSSQDYQSYHQHYPLSSNCTRFRNPEPPTHLQTLISSPPCTSSRFVLTFAFPSTTLSTLPHNFLLSEMECWSWRIRSRSCRDDK